MGGAHGLSFLMYGRPATSEGQGGTAGKGSGVESSSQTYLAVVKSSWLNDH